MMVKWNIKLLAYMILASSTLSAMLLDTSLPKHHKEGNKEEVESSKVISTEKLVDFKYDGVSLKKILDDFAQERSFNIVYSPTDSLTTKITFDAGKKLTMSESWDFLMMLLDQAGFTLHLKDAASKTYMLMTNKKAYTEGLPLYFNTDYTLLSDNAEKIRYVYYFNSIQLAKQQNEINQMLTTIFSSQEIKDAVIYDKDSNSIILSAKAEMIKVVMRLLTTFDEAGFQEAVEVLPLKYAQASEVAQILKSMVDSSGAKKPTGAVPLSTGGQKIHMFSEIASVVDLDPKNSRKLNSVVIMGKTTDVEAIKNFIKKYLDIAQQKGKSFYHVIELQWLKASDFANNVLSTLTQGGSGQSTGTGTSPLAFDPVKVVPDSVSQGASVGGGSNTVQRGGNRLVIAATQKDWDRIEELIKKVDVPQKQVIIEALVMDLNLKLTRSLASQLRTRGICSSIFPKYMQAQANMLVESILEDGGGDASTLEADLSNILNPSRTSGSPFTASVDSGTVGTVAPIGTSGSTVFMVGQSKMQTNGVWGFFQLLSKHESAKVLTRPVLIAKNNTQAKVSSAVSKNIIGGTSGNISGTQNFSDDSAPISIGFTPLISDNNTVNLQIDISLNSYLNPSDENSAAKFTREIKTNVSMKSGDVIILGGLSKERNERTKRSIPLLENIPIIGSLTSARNKLITKEQLFILIRPTVVAPRTEGGMGSITKSAINFINNELADTEETFSNLKDPVTRWFFREDEPRTSEKVQETMSKLTLGFEDPVLKGNLQVETKDLSNQDKELDMKWLSSKSNKKAEIKSKEIVNIEQQLQNITNPFEDRLQL